MKFASVKLGNIAGSVVSFKECFEEILMVVASLEVVVVVLVEVVVEDLTVVSLLGKIVEFSARLSISGDIALTLVLVRISIHSLRNDNSR